MVITKAAETGYPFLKGGGDMGRRVRELDWAKTSLGTPDKWPPSLQAAVSILLNSQFPMFVWWGSDLITIYNDAYRIVAGDKHPALLGSSGKIGWAEIWPDLEPLVDNVFSGYATWSEDLPLAIKRSDRIEETFFTFSYSPILIENGSIGGLFCACIETTEKVFGKKRLEESEQNLRNTILQAPVAMFLFRGDDLVVETINAKALEMIRRTEAIVGKPLLEAVPELKDTQAYEILQEVYHTGIAQYGQEVLVPLEKDGILEDRYFNFAYTPLLQGGTVVGVMDVATEVTDQVLARRKIEEVVALRTAELAAANTELKRSNSHLEEFAHAASHDLKEPIRKIHYFTDRLKKQLEDKLSAEDRRMFERVEDASNRMHTLIDDLLLYSHVTQQPFQKEAIDLNVQIKRVLEDLELYIQEKEAEIKLEHLPVVQGYKRQLQQLFLNLLTNALKFNRPGVKPEIKIYAAVVAGTEAGLPADAQFHRITVQDNGIGFDPEQAERIFQMFQRLHGKNEYAGTGIGLSIAQKVAENHEGKIMAQSVPGEGASFHLFLPLE